MQSAEYYSPLAIGNAIVSPTTGIVNLTEQLLYTEGATPLYSGCPSVISKGRDDYSTADYQGSIIAVTDSAGTVVQTTNYYPYGEPWREPTGQPMLFGGKERTSLADYHFDPRNYVASGIHWTAPDLKAHTYTSISPYSFCGGNPIANIEINGMDYFKLNENGELTERIEDKEKDVVEIRTQDKIKKMEFVTPSIESVSTISTPQFKDIIPAGSAVVFEVRGDAVSKDLFEFLADNINAEYTRIATGEKGDLGLNYISTSHNEINEVGAALLFENKLQYGYTLRFHIHSHPRGNSIPGKTDGETRDEIRKRTGQTIKFYQYNPATKIYVEY